MRRRGGLIGAKKDITHNAASGMWSLTDAQQELGAMNWLGTYANLTDLANFGESVALTLSNSNGQANMFKTASANSWGGSIRGSVGYTAPCTIEFNKNSSSSDDTVSYAMVGWNEDPTANDSYNTLDYAAYPYRTAAYEVYHNGTGIAVATAWSTALKFYVVYTVDGYIKHYNGSTLLYTSPLYGTGKTVYFDSSFYSVNVTNGGFSNVRVARKAWNGTAYA